VRAIVAVAIPTHRNFPEAITPAAVSNISVRSKTLKFVRKLVTACQSAPML
jgi:hypothetical protein